LLLNTNDGGFLCSGSLLGSGHVLTAAHCVTNDIGRNILFGGDAFFFPSPSGTEVISVTGVSIHPNWTGDLFGGADLALIRLANSASAGVQRYDIYSTDDDISKTYNVAGFGRRGSFGQGDTLPAGSRRQGKNTFDGTLAAFGFGSSAILLSDFDSGLLANDGFNFFLGRAPHLGLGFDEVATAPGDSGGPSFIDGKVAGITSFGVTFWFPDGSSSDISPMVLNSSWGEFDGITRVSSYVDWINGPHNFTLVPEPGSLLLCGIGLLCVAIRYRRSR
jgi:secreted trypsin-like serine protease